MTLASQFLAGAMVAQVLLTLVLLLWLGKQRVPLVMQGKIRIRDVALSKEAWPPAAQQASNAFDNQFQLPVLFHVGALLALQLGALPHEAALGWLFVLLRIAHAVIHVTDNNVGRRFIAYVGGFAALALFWLALAVRILVTPVVV
jgi:hypothetical protein